LNIGLIGVGNVGNAVKYGFQIKRGHNVTVHDIKFSDTSVKNILTILI